MKCIAFFEEMNELSPSVPAIHARKQHNIHLHET